MNISKLFFARNAIVETPADEPAAPSIEYRREWTMETDDLNPKQILEALRQRTIDFSEEFDLQWAASDLNYGGLYVRVDLTVDQDIVYSVEGEETTNIRNAVAMICQQAINF